MERRQPAGIGVRFNGKKAALVSSVDDVEFPAAGLQPNVTFERQGIALLDEQIQPFNKGGDIVRLNPSANVTTRR